MTESLTFIVGSKVIGTDGHLGHLVRVIVDPVERTVTHLVVEPHHVRELARLAPIDIVTDTDGEVRLSVSRAEFESLDSAEETELVRNDSEAFGSGPGQIFEHPYYGLAMRVGVGRGAPEEPTTFTVDRVPRGEVQVQRGDHVLATDGPVGHVRGLVVDDSAEHHVTHILMAEGHLLGRKEIAIPIGAVLRVDSLGAHLSLSRKELEGLPEIGVDLRTSA